MFEKEVQERFVKSYPEFCYNGKPLSPYWDLWQDGAEFGFQKGFQKGIKEGIKAKLNITTISDCPIFRTKWHKVADGDLPEEPEKEDKSLIFGNMKEYRPFSSFDELIAEFVKRFQTKTPSYALPLIWVKSSNNNDRYLITGYIDNEENGQFVKIGDKYYGLSVLFENFQFLDNSPCGVKD